MLKQPVRMPLRTITFVLALLLALVACSKRESPEQRIRALIESAEEAVEKKDIGTVRGYVSERYRDEDGRDRRSAEGILKLYVLRNETIHLFTRIASISLAAPDRAQAIVYVAMAARPITRAEELGAFNANLYRFELSFAEEDKQWRIVRAAWRPAEPTDFIHQ